MLLSKYNLFRGVKMDINNELLEKYQVRKTRKQKDEFIKFATEQIDELGYKYKTNENHKGCKSRNIVVGDVNNAKVIFTAHYDTCARLPFPNFCTPLNMPLYILFQLLICIPLFLVLWLANWAKDVLLDNFLIFAERNLFSTIATIVVCFIPVFICFIFIWLIMCGPANKHTANDNTSGVATLFDIMKKMPQDKRNNVAFVFFDHEVDLSIFV